MHQVAVDEIDDDLGHLWLRRQGIAKPYLDVFVVAEATGNGEDHGQNGNDGQQRAVGQCGSLRQHPLVQEKAYGKDDTLGDADQEILPCRNLIVADVPDVGLEELDDVLCFHFNSSYFISLF